LVVRECVENFDQGIMLQDFFLARNKLERLTTRKKLGPRYGTHNSM